MGDLQAPQALPEDVRLAEIVDVVVAIASNDFSVRASVGDGSHLLDGLASGLNMLAEEVGKRHAQQRSYQERLLQNERLIAVGQLAAGVAHEINNPAAFVLANLDTLQKDCDRLDARLAASLDPLVSAADLRAQVPAMREMLHEARELIRDNATGVQRIVNIVRELRNFSRIDHDRLEHLALEDIIADAAKLVRAEVSYRARFIIEIPSGLRVRGDRTKLTQVFTNLLINAAQAIPEGDTQHHVVQLETRTANGRAIITVRDTGTGMSTEAQHRLFEPFFTTKPRESGTGLGLAISGDIVRHHGGEVRLVETSPAGTTFEVQLPLDTSAAATVRRETPRSSASATRARVLIIDDEPLLLRAYERSLHDHFEVTQASSGRDAIALMAEPADWDAILCDVMMPDMDGVAVYEWAATNRPAMLDRIVFCTGGAFTPRSQAFAERLGARLLQKPMAVDVLRTAIENVRPRRV